MRICHHLSPWLQQGTSANHVASSSILFDPRAAAATSPAGAGARSPALPLSSPRCCAAAAPTVAKTFGRVGSSQTPALKNNHRQSFGLNLGYYSRLRYSATMMASLRSFHAWPGEIQTTIQIESPIFLSPNTLLPKIRPLSQFQNQFKF